MHRRHSVLKSNGSQQEPRGVRKSKSDGLCSRWPIIDNEDEYEVLNEHPCSTADDILILLFWETNAAVVFGGDER